MNDESEKKFPLSDYPQLVDEWHSTKNDPLSIKDLTLGSGRKVWWKCPKGDDHEWGASVCDRVKRGYGCPFCSGRRITRLKSLGTLWPDVARQWHPTRNKDITPFEVSPFSAKKAWWICPNGIGHEWEAAVGSITLGNGCPFCSGHKVSFAESIASKYPELASQIHPTKNQGLTGREISPTYRRNVWWACLENPAHVYETSPLTRCKQFDSEMKNPCPECNGIKTCYPTLASQWHPTKNLPNNPETTSTGSNFRATWICDKNPSHEWKQTVKSRVMALKKNVTRGSECPICLNRKANKENCLAVTHPILAKEWDQVRNTELGLCIDQITAVSRSKAFWICSKNPTHRWDTVIRHRATTKKRKGSGCPYCINRKVSNESSIVYTHPQLNKEWHPTKNLPLTPHDITFGSDKKVFWLCTQDTTHEWQASVGSRSLGRGCPYCARWTIDRMRLFVKSMSVHIHNLNPAELFALFERSGALSSNGQAKAIAKAIQSRTVSKEELIAFSEGQPSVLEDVLAKAQEEDQSKEESPYNSDLADELSSEDVNPLNAMPTVQAGAALAALDKVASIITDEDAIKFFIASARSKIWQHASTDEKGALQQVKEFHGDTYAEEVKRAFEDEYRGATSLDIPKIADESITPNLMQRLICFKVLMEKRLGNWSGTGAGKTLSAVIASRVVKSKLTVIICPNNVIPEWEKTVPRAFPKSEVIVKDFSSLNGVMPKHPAYLVLNYEFFQQPLCRMALERLIDKYRIDFCVLDEVHFTKQRGQAKMSIRKSNIFWFLQQIHKANPDLHVLGMSATPVINNIFEGKTLLELILGVQLDAIETKNTMQNCMALHQMLIRYGVRIRPRYTSSLSIRTIKVDCMEAIPEITRLGKRDILGLEIALMKVKIPCMLQELRPKTLIYCHYVETIVDMVKVAVREAGYRVAVFTGQEKELLEKFTKGEVDVLIASRCISTGVDGLQKVCSRVIVASLPWTGAEFEQLVGRVYRQGQPKEQVDIIIPLTFLELHGEKRSWCQGRYDCIKYKKTIADAAVDGIIPDEHIRSPEQAFEDHMAWLRSLGHNETTDNM